eukprot:m.83435 g.83435  ORF g.83435 m.83435 type:complete len:334 (-) comp12921_c0_seq4:1359-2360(-)
MDKEFNINDTLHTQATQTGRLRHFLDLADPRCLMPEFFFGVSLENARRLLDNHVKGDPSAKPPHVSNEKLWTAKKIVTAAVHPDTNETIPMPFRMSGFAVFGSPIVFGMLLPNPTGNMLQAVFWQSLNQSHNACVNFANRNATSPVTAFGAFQGWMGAVATSVPIALGLGQLVKMSKLDIKVKATLSRFVPYPAVASANIANLLMMRWGELQTGIFVKDNEGNVLGSSKRAAQLALFDTGITRVVIPMPLLLIPPMIMTGVQSAIPSLRSRPRLRIVVEAGVCVGAFIFGLPFALSLFPQQGSVEVSRLEPQFHNLLDSHGQPIQTVNYNKGL